jgi:hypothetical protein
MISLTLATGDAEPGRFPRPAGCRWGEARQYPTRWLCRQPPRGTVKEPVLLAIPDEPRCRERAESWEYHA